MTKKQQSPNGLPANKSQAIREVFTQDPNADSKTVIARAGEKGVKVTPTMVYYIRSKLKQADRRAKRARVAESSRQTMSKNPVELVRRVKELAQEVGGIANLKSLVDLLAE